MNRRMISAAFALLFIIMSIAGCGGESVQQYPVMDPIDISSMELALGEDSEIKYSVPADKWILGTNNLNALIAVLADSYGTDQQAAINVSIGDYSGDPFDQEFADGVKASTDAEALGTKVKLTEIGSFNGTNICYSEAVTEYTDDVIDNLMEYGILTEEGLEAIGGREFLLSMPATEQITVQHGIDKKLITYGGIYYTAEQKDAVLEAINIMLQTTELK